MLQSLGVEQTTPKPFVFVLMPFDGAFDDIYQLGIKAACKEAGGYCERVDEQIFVESILERVYNQIDKADLLIADMTGRNANVFYEVGYAHGLGKRVLLLTQNADDIPFDLKHYPHIVYGGKITELKQELEKRVRWAFEHPKEYKKASEEQIHFFIGGNRILNCPQIKFKRPYVGPVSLNLVFDIHNSTENAIEQARFQVGLVHAKAVGIMTVNNARKNGGETHQTRSISLSKDLSIVIIDSLLEVLPGSWEKISFNVFDHQDILSRQSELKFAIRLFSEAGPVDYPFVVTLEPDV